MFRILKTAQNISLQKYRVSCSEMPEVVKYERIQTTESEIYADEDNYKAENGKSIISPATATRIEIPSQRSRFSVAQATAATLVLILFYFCLSIGLTFYQRWLLKVSSKLITLL